MSRERDLQTVGARAVCSLFECLQRAVDCVYLHTVFVVISANTNTHNTDSRSAENDENDVSSEIKRVSMPPPVLLPGVLLPWRPARTV